MRFKLKTVHKGFLADEEMKLLTDAKFTSTDLDR